MRTLYLKHTDESVLKAQIKQLFPAWDEIHMDVPSNGLLHCVYLGEHKGEYLANVLAPDDYLDKDFEGFIATEPVTPLHKFA